MLESLLVSFKREVGVSKLSVGDDEKEDAFVVDGDEDFALR